jgi:hypothetical protein
MGWLSSVMCCAAVPLQALLSELLGQGVMTNNNVTPHCVSVDSQPHFKSTSAGLTSADSLRTGATAGGGGDEVVMGAAVGSAAPQKINSAPGSRATGTVGSHSEQQQHMIVNLEHDAFQDINLWG